MIREPWPMTADHTRYVVPRGPYLTPMYRGDRVALRVSQEDHDKVRRGPGVYGIVTDLDTGTRYTIQGRICERGAGCYCDAEIVEAT